MSVKAHKPIRARNDVVNDGQSRKSRVVRQRHVAFMRAVSARIQIQSRGFQLLELRVGDAFHGLVDAVEIDIHAAFHGGFGYVQAVAKAGFIGPAGNEHAEFFSTQFHGRTVSGRALECQTTGFRTIQ